jgi:outer membrane receptor protein involved in Fe transport
MRMSFERTGKAPARRFGLLFGAAAVALGAGAAHAQQTIPVPAPAAPEASAEDEVIVTGSRIRRDATNAPQPLIQLGREDLLNSGEANVIDYLADLPALQASFVAEDTVGGSLGTGGLSLLDLRNFGPGKTLVLVDGRRHVGSAYFASSAVDIDTIPRLLIENVEVITGGSSAVYGADAVVGVVNFTLRKDFEGAEVDAAYAQINQDGQVNGRISGLFGKNFLNDRLNVYVSGEYESNDEVTNRDLDWFTGDRVLLQNDLDPAAPNNNDGVTDVIVGFGYSSISRARGGTLTVAHTLRPSATNDPDLPVTPCNTPTVADPFNANCFINDPGFSYTFNANGVGRPLDFGTGRANAGANRNNVLNSPDARPLVDLATVSRLPATDNYRFQTGFNYEVRPGLEVFAEGKYVRDETLSSSSPIFFNIGIRNFGATEVASFRPTNSVNAFSIGLDNAYLDPAIRTLIQNNTRTNFAAPTPTAPGAPTTTVADARALYSTLPVGLGTRAQENTRETMRFVGGVRGEVDDFLSVKNIAWEAAYTWAEAEDNNTEALVDSERYAFAADAVVDTAGLLGTPGAIVCRVRLRAAQGIPIPIGADIQRARTPVRNYSPSDPAIANCVPFNVFGTDTVPDNVRGYVSAGQFRGFKTKQEDFLAFASGDLFDLWGAGPIGVAAGFETRKETFSGFIGPASRENRVIFGNIYTPTPENDYDVTEYFVETKVPLLTDQPGFKKLEIGGAYRVSNYSNIGVTDAWSLQGTWRPIDDFMFRYARSRSVRAPQLNELFRGPAQTFTAITDNCSRPVIDATANAQVRANRNANCAALGIPSTYVDPNPNSNNPGVNGPNPNLREEEGTSQTFSFILTPRFLPGFELVLDYYDIQIGNVINTVGIANLLNLCVDNVSINSAACGLISRDPVTFEINNYTQGGFNYASQRAKGIDFAASYDVGLSDIFNRDVGELTLGIRGNYSIRRQDFNDVFNPAIATDIDSFISDPRVRFVLETTYEKGPFAVTWEGDFQASQEIFDSRVLLDDPDNRLPSLLETGDFWQHDFTLKYEPNDKIRFRAGVINAFDEEPSPAAELVPAGQPVSAAGSVDQFDLFGRRFFAGVNVRF